MPRGGRRPGAGAPIGNLNGLIHGRYSKQLLALSRDIVIDPRVRNMVLAFVRATRAIQDGTRYRPVNQRKYLKGRFGQK